MQLLADLALEFRVQTFVYYSSTMRPGTEEGDFLDPSRRAKQRIEVYCQELGEKGLNWM